jgi:predicted metal-binding protein
MELDLTRKIVKNFRYAIFFMLRVPSQELTNPDFKQKKAGAISSIKQSQIIAKLESEAFYDGYHLAMAFGGGPCQPYLCADQECAALVPGQRCRHPLKARPSMEAVGMDAYLMATKVGWEIYPIGGSVSSSEIPSGNRLGLVLIS